MDNNKKQKLIAGLANSLARKSLHFLDGEYKDQMIDDSKRSDILDIILSGHLNSLFNLMVIINTQAENEDIDLMTENFIERIKKFFLSQPGFEEIRNIREMDRK